MLDKIFIEERKNDLLSQKQRLEKELSDMAYQENGSYKAKFPKLGNEDEDNELEVSEYEQNIDAEKNLAKMLAETIEALEKIEQGTYGYCENCKQEIDPERLKAYPAAVTCIACDKK